MRRTASRFTFFAAVAAAGMLIAGCGSSGADGPSAGAAASSDLSPVPTSSAAAAAAQTSSDPAAPSGSAAPGAATALDPQCGKETRTITHDLGTTTIKGDPAKVVVLEFPFADALASIGEKPIGIADDGDPSRIIPQVAEKIGTYTSVGTRQSPSLQNIAALKPDLIIADTSRHKDIYDQLSKIAPTISLAGNKSTYESNLKAAETISVAMNRCQQMADRLAKNSATIAAIAAKMPNDLPPVLFVVSTDKQVTEHNAASYPPSVLMALGLKYLLPADAKNPTAEASEETVATQNPSVVFLSAATDQTLFEAWAADPVGGSLTAVKDGKVFKVDNNLWSRAKGITASEVMAQQALDLLTGGGS
ncbi:ABC transporter substrate-binding protein [Nakamurella lactea]|uniref:ABC transporter substrate-binding protein n=1 Tax=Nakamurella lactea TaxID=459515 RepID=UPI0003FD677F|nr:Fe(3+) dicitrate ABC transporter substrate-binding protein [Nakamurella lactea]